jgi:branched-chain amino acid transport system ATP-binding protein
MALLELQSVTSGYGRSVVLREVSLAVAAGEIVALIGANGAGKSTLLNTIMGVVPLMGGTIAFDGRPIARAPTPGIVRAGMVQVPERRQLFGTMTVEENLRMGAYVIGRAEVAALLEAQYAQFPILRERRAQAAQTLSGGEQQMVAIARALMAKPKMLLLDEPSLGLAPLIVQQIVELIVGLRKRGVTSLIVEQNARVALENADRGYVIETGRIAMSGTSEELLHDAAVLEAYLGGASVGGNSMEDRIRAKKLAMRAESGQAKDPSSHEPLRGSP